MTLEGAFDTIAFEIYVRELRCPSLRPGQIVLTDNLSVHKSQAVRDRIAAAGCSLVFLPSYSPDLSPIELAFSKIKEALRRAGARTQAELDEAITQAINLITGDDAIGWFEHCGYLACSK